MQRALQGRGGRLAHLIYLPRAGEPDFSKKHPLETPWTLWFDNPNGKQRQSTWGQTLRAVYTFSTVEDFWW